MGRCGCVLFVICKQKKIFFVCVFGEWGCSGWGFVCVRVRGKLCVCVCVCLIK